MRDFPHLKSLDLPLNELWTKQDLLDLLKAIVNNNEVDVQTAAGHQLPSTRQGLVSIEQSQAVILMSITPYSRSLVLMQIKLE